MSQSSLKHLQSEADFLESILMRNMRYHQLLIGEKLLHCDTSGADAGRFLHAQILYFSNGSCVYVKEDVPGVSYWNIHTRDGDNLHWMEVGDLVGLVVSDVGYFYDAREWLPFFPRIGFGAFQLVGTAQHLPAPLLHMQNGVEVPFP